MHDDYGSFRAKLLVRIFAGKPSPRQVGDYLASKMERYPQIRQGEVDLYRLWGDAWPVGVPPVVALVGSHGWGEAKEWPEPSPPNPIEP